MIAIFSAMRIEIAGLVETMTDRRTERVGRIEINTGKIGGQTVLAVVCGVGLVAAAATVGMIVERYRPEAVINIGVAGGLKNQAPLSAVIPAAVIQHDMDTTAVGDPIGFLSDFKCVSLATDAALSTALWEASNREADKDCTMASGDCFVATEEGAARIRAIFGADCVDMESAGIVHAAKLFCTPCAVLRVISDRVSAADYYVFLEKATKKIAALLLHWLEDSDGGEQRKEKR